MLSHNTTYHFTIATMPFALLFGEKQRLPLFPNPDIQKLHYGKSTSAEHYHFYKKLGSWLKTFPTTKELKFLIKLLSLTVSN
jgi:hypothetical protein